MAVIISADPLTMKHLTKLPWRTAIAEGRVCRDACRPPDLQRSSREALTIYRTRLHAWISSPDISGGSVFAPNSAALIRTVVPSLVQRAFSSFTQSRVTRHTRRVRDHPFGRHAGMDRVDG